MTDSDSELQQQREILFGSLMIDNMDLFMIEQVFISAVRIADGNPIGFWLIEQKEGVIAISRDV